MRAICQNCRIKLIEAPNAKTTSLGAAENVGGCCANIISNSFGGYDGRGSSAMNSPFIHPNKAVRSGRRQRLWLAALPG